MPKAEPDITEFIRLLIRKMNKGKKEHKNVFPSTMKCVDEIEAEMLDICGWSYLLWKRLQNLKKSLKNITKTTKP